jgi:hypothetical protein
MVDKITFIFVQNLETAAVPEVLTIKSIKGYVTRSNILIFLFTQKGNNAVKSDT